MVGAFIPSRAILLANRDQHVNTITDALARVITFNYDATASSPASPRERRPMPPFAWGTAALNYNFSPSLSVGNTSPNGTSLRQP